MTVPFRSRKLHPARPSDLRRSNRRTLLSLLRQSEACSRADLTRLSGLSAPTVGAAIHDLRSDGLVEVLESGKSSGGRPSEVLRFRAEHSYVAGADIGGTRIRMILSDLEGKQISTWDNRLLPNQKDPDSITHLVSQGLVQMCSNAKIGRNRVKHVTVGAPGVTDVAKGIVLSAPNLTQWSQVPLAKLLSKKVGIPVRVENDTNLAAVGEHWAGVAQKADDFIFIAMGTGVGAGIFLRGQLHHGAAWTAGEIGYLGVPGMPRGKLRMKRTGQLERAIGGDGIERSWKARLRDSNRLRDRALTRLRGSQIFDLASSGDRDALWVLKDVAMILADVISTITLLFNPTIVVLGGGVGSSEPLRRKTEELLKMSDFDHPTVLTSSLGTRAQLCGAVALSISEVEEKLLC